MRIGIVSPYSFDVPGGVQNHIMDLAEALIGLGHEVSVLAPADEDADLPPYVVAAGRAVPLPYNGSVARIAFGPVRSGVGSGCVRRGARLADRPGLRRPAACGSGSCPRTRSTFRAACRTTSSTWRRR